MAAQTSFLLWRGHQEAGALLRTKSPKSSHSKVHVHKDAQRSTPLGAGASMSTKASQLIGGRRARHIVPERMLQAPRAHEMQWGSEGCFAHAVAWRLHVCRKAANAGVTGVPECTDRCSAAVGRSSLRALGSPRWRPRDHGSGRPRSTSRASSESTARASEGMHKCVRVRPVWH